MWSRASRSTSRPSPLLREAFTVEDSKKYRISILERVLKNFFPIFTLKASLKCEQNSEQKILDSNGNAVGNSTSDQCDENKIEILDC